MLCTTLGARASLVLCSQNITLFQNIAELSYSQIWDWKADSFLTDPHTPVDSLLIYTSLCKKRLKLYILGLVNKY